MANYSYLADGTKLSATDAAGDGLVYAGSLVYKKQGNSLNLESAAFAGGRFIANQTSAGTIFTPQYHLTDHLGSTRVVIDGNSGNVTERNDYYPFGLRIDKADYEIADNRYRYNGKEEQDFVNVPFVDYGARMYDSKYRIAWNSIDPLAEQQHSGSPFAFCGNNPIKYVDPNGMMADWYETLDDDLIKQIKYTELTSQQALDNAGINGRYLGQVVVIFDGSYSEKLGEGGYLNKDGAVLAEVTVYGPKGENDIAQYPGFTMTSNFEKFGAIADGEYNVSHVEANPNSRIPKTHIINNGEAVDCVNGVNPSPKEYDPYSSTQKDKIYVHRSNLNGWAGDDPEKHRAVSSGCLLIQGDYWQSYDKQINKHNYKLILRRTK